MTQGETQSETPLEPNPVTPPVLLSFDDLPLSPLVRQSIAEKGYLRPTSVQAAAIGSVLKHRDVIVRSKTGTGKTAAFGIPVVELVDAASPWVQAIALCNTRELAMQVAAEIAELGKHKGVKVVAIYGGASADQQIKELEAGASVVVGTPGRVIDLIERRQLKLDRTKIAVLDEADEMLGVGFLEDVKRILGKLPNGHQTLLFSATVSPDLEGLIQKHLNDPETILLSGDEYTVEGIKNVYYFAQDAYPKPRNLLYMLTLENPETAIIFCNTRDDVNLICTVLNRAGYDADKLSGELAQTDRERVMARIKRGELRYMVATDIAARGIDISDLSHVINYSLPEDPSVYLHRVGRTGRIGKTGTALSLVRGTELVTLTALQKKFGIQFEERKLPAPEEAHRQWVESHLDELRQQLGTQLFDAYVPLAQDLKQRAGGEVLIAFALKYFFHHHRLERAAALRQDDDRRQADSIKKEHKGRLQERRIERAQPVLDAPAPRAPAAEPRPSPVKEIPPGPSGTRLYVGIGTAEGLDTEGLKGAIAAIVGTAPDSILRIDALAAHSYVEVSPDTVATFLAANGRSHVGKPVKIEVARPRTSRRRRT